MEQHFIRQIQILRQKAAALMLYQSVLATPAGEAFLQILDALVEGNGLRDGLRDRTTLQVLRAYGQWITALAKAQQSWRDYVVAQVLLADNPFTQHIQSKPLSALPQRLINAAQDDLRNLQCFYECQGDQVAQWVQQATGNAAPSGVWDEAAPSVLPSAAAGAIAYTLHKSSDWGQALEDLATYHQTAGVGLFAQYRALRWVAGTLVGVAVPDPVDLDALVGYDLPRQLLLQNTEALMAGYPALHVLLYGSRGAGKSSMVKALLNRYGDRGLRLIEVNRADLRDLIEIVEVLRHLPQRFIIFVDDLSFEEDDDAFKALKVVLEGTVMARPINVVVYATSNRRHLIREFMGDRPRPKDADEVHAWDTVQEKLSFGDRFGLTLTFEPANQDTYLTIIRHLAQRENIALPASDLEFRALQWATRHNGRSGRTARQFIDFLKADLALNPAS